MFSFHVRKKRQFKSPKISTKILQKWYNFPGLRFYQEENIKSWRSAQSLSCWIGWKAKKTWRGPLKKLPQQLIMKVFDTFRKWQCIAWSQKPETKIEWFRRGVTCSNLHKTATLVHYTFKSSTKWTAGNCSLIKSQRIACYRRSVRGDGAKRCDRKKTATG